MHILYPYWFCFSVKWYILLHIPFLNWWPNIFYNGHHVANGSIWLAQNGMLYLGQDRKLVKWQNILFVLCPILYTWQQCFVTFVFPPRMGGRKDVRGKSIIKSEDNAFHQWRLSGVNAVCAFAFRHRAALRMKSPSPISHFAVFLMEERRKEIH